MAVKKTRTRGKTAAPGSGALAQRAGRGAQFAAAGNKLIDFYGAAGALILGQAQREVAAAGRGAFCSSAGAGTKNTAAELAATICRLAPDVERVRLVNSGAAAVIMALRLARGFTNRRRLLIFDGCCHEHVDGLLVDGEALVVPYNNLDAVNAMIAGHGAELAAVVVEPVAVNMGLVMPDPGFLIGLRAACNRCGALLILDELTTGFRFGPTTYGAIAGVHPDLTILGKIIGGGMPVGAVGGRTDIMTQFAAEPMCWDGICRAHPAAAAAGLAALRVLEAENPYARMEELTARLAAGVNAAAHAAGCQMFCAHAASLFAVYFHAGPAPRNLEEVKSADAGQFAGFAAAMRKAGFYLPPSQFETAFISAAHTARDVNAFIRAVARVLPVLKQRSADPARN